MHSTSVYGLKDPKTLSFERCGRKTDLATDHRVRDCFLNTLIEVSLPCSRLTAQLMAVQISLEIPSLDELHDDEILLFGLWTKLERILRQREKHPV